MLTMHVTAAQAGSRTASIWYLNGAPARTFDLSVNGGPARLVTAASTFDWNALGSVRVTVDLQAGDNTLTFSNHAGQWAPNFAAVVLLS